MNIKQFTKWSFKAHSWLGLALGLLYIFFGLSGSLLVFQKEIESHSGIHHVQKGIRRLPLDSIYRLVVKTHPGIRQLVVHDFPENSEDSYEFMLYTYQRQVTDNYLYSVIVNPYDGNVIREGSFNNIDASFFRWLYSAHYCLQADKPGRLITAIIALTLFVNLATGIVIYRKHIWKVLTFRTAFRFSKKGGAISSAHRIIGVWTLLFNFILFFTGFWMNKSLFLPQEWELIRNPKQTFLVAGNLDSIYLNARAVTGFTPIAMKVAVDAEKEVVVSGQFASTTNLLYTGKGSDLYYNSRTNALNRSVHIEDKAFSDRFYWAMKQLHVGHFHSLTIRWLYVFIGFVPAMLSISGFYLYWRRRHRRKR